MNVAPLTYVSWFAGAGSLDLGIRIALPGARCIGYVEIEATAAEILVARFADGSLESAPVWSDIRTWPGDIYRGHVDLAIFGAPCQPYSVAGKQLGDADSRYLWDHIFRAIESCQPALVFLENVPALLKWFEPIGHRLSSLGYRFAAGLFSAQEVGAPHKRERFFAVAHCENRQRRSQQSAGKPAGGGRRGPSGSGGALHHLESSRCAGPGRPPQSPGLDGPRTPDDDRRTGGAMADTGHGFLPLLERKPQERDGSGSGSPQLAGSASARLPLGPDPPGDSGPPPWIAPPERGGFDILNDLALIDAILAEAAGELANPVCPVRQPSGPDRLLERSRRELEHTPWGFRSGSHGEAGSGWGARGASHPLDAPYIFPPYRTGDDARWQDVLVSRPWLRPSLALPEVESDLRRVAHGLADLLAGGRTDALRACGNGAVCATAALAFISLTLELGIGTWNETHLHLHDFASTAESPTTAKEDEP